MTLMEVTQLSTGAASWLFIAFTLVQISPLKINPWSWLATKLGNLINKRLEEKLSSQINDLDKKVGEIDTRVTSLSTQIEVNAVLASRSNILRFGDELVRAPNIKHTQEQFEQILRSCDQYEFYCREHPNFENNQAVLTIARIKEVYAHCLRDGDFL